MEGALQRQHDSMVNAESMDNDEWKAFSQDLSNHTPEPAG